jgi:putative ABC transport system ATP-binding protein
MRMPEYSSTEYDLGVHAQNLSITTNAGDKLLDDVSVHIGQGEHVAIIGSSGAGKSLLATALCGIRFNEDTSRFRRQKKTVQYDGSVYYDLAEKESGTSVDLPENYDIRRRNIGFVPQRLILDDDMTAEGNILYPNRLKQIAPSPELPQVYDYLKLSKRVLGQQIWTLSGGEQQRVAIARAFAHGPNAVIMDEPTSSLDQELKAETNVMLDNIVRNLGVTIISVTHEESLAPRRIKMEDGKIVSDSLFSQQDEQPSDTVPPVQS